MSDFFFLDQADVQRGPVAAEMLPRYGVTPETLVWTQGMPDWRRAGDIAELRPVFFGAASTYIDSEGTPDAPSPSDAAPQGAAPPQGQNDGSAEPACSQAQAPQLMEMPQTHLTEAVLLTLCCNTVFGIIALFFVMQVKALYNRGLYADAWKASIRGWTCIKLGFWVAIIIIALYAVFYFILFVVIGVSSQLLPYHGF